MVTAKLHGTWCGSFLWPKQINGHYFNKIFQCKHSQFMTDATISITLVTHRGSALPKVSWLFDRANLGLRYKTASNLSKFENVFAY